MRTGDDKLVFVRTLACGRPSHFQRGLPIAAEYYTNHHAVPSDNAAAGIAPDTSITGKYVSSVDVSGGKITVAFGTAGANVTVRDKVLVLSPNTSGGQITWMCSAGSTVPERDLPLACRH